MNYRAAFWWLSLVVSTAALVLYLARPELREALLEEDRGIETATVVAYVVAALLAVASLLRMPSGRNISLLFLIFALVGILEETSYGGRLLQLTPPRVLDVEIDTAHDIVFLILKVLKDAILDNLILVAIPLCIMVLCAWLLHRYWNQLMRAWLYFRSTDATFFLIVFVALGVIAIVVDIIVLPLERRAPALHDILQLGEELLEACAALALAIGAFTCVMRRQSVD